MTRTLQEKAANVPNSLKLCVHNKLTNWWTYWQAEQSLYPCCACMCMGSRKESYWLLIVWFLSFHDYNYYTNNHEICSPLTPCMLTQSDVGSCCSGCSRADNVRNALSHRVQDHEGLRLTLQHCTTSMHLSFTGIFHQILHQTMTFISVIHCYRNPLDSHTRQDFWYSSSQLISSIPIIKFLVSIWILYP